MTRGSASNKSIFTARQKMASDDILNLKAKLETMQGLRPECRDEVQSLIVGLEQIRKELNQIDTNRKKSA